MTDEATAELRSGKYTRDFVWAEGVITAERVNTAEITIGSADAMALLQEALHRRCGVQMRVDQRVSDMMLRTDFSDVRFREIAWPAKSLEIIWEDRQLPTLLISKQTPNELAKAVGSTLAMPDGNIEMVIARIDQTPSARNMFLPVRHVLSLSEPMWDAEFGAEQPIEMKLADSFTREEALAIRELMTLAFKVFAYCALPRYDLEHVPVVTRNMGGKAGYQNRPTRPVKRVVYLPRVHSERTSDQSGSPRPRGAYSGHDGYFKTYRHERFVNVRGTRVFIPPLTIEGVPRAPKLLRVV